jgi:hypothetical protein
MKLEASFHFLIFLISSVNATFRLADIVFEKVLQKPELFVDLLSSKLRILQTNIERELFILCQSPLIFSCVFLISKYFSLKASNFLSEYDFIIVGSGSGGCVLANRLTQNPNWNVLLIEAGEVETIIQNLPALAAANQKTDYDWAYKIERQENACLGMNDQKCNYPRGKGIGGSSLINYMIYNRYLIKHFLIE